MRYSLFRIKDVFEAFAIYQLCFFSSSLLFYLKKLNINNSLILKSFLDSITDNKFIIIVLLSTIIIIFHYQFINKKRIEIFCRILVGDTITKIIIRYVLVNLGILSISFLLSFLYAVYLNLNILNNTYVFFIFIIYILINSLRVKKYENNKIFYN